MAELNASSVRLTLMDKVNVCLQDFGDHVMHLVFEVEGKINPDRMQKAARLSLQRHPIMAQKLSYGWWRLRWRHWDKNTLDHYNYCERIETKNLENSIQSFLTKQQDYQNEPMVKIAAIAPQHSNHDTVCVKVSCVPIDGRAFLIYCESLLDIYQKLEQNPDYQPEPGNLTHRSTKDLLPYFTSLDLIKLVIYGLKNQLTDARTAHNWAFPSRSHATFDNTYYCHQFKDESLDYISALRQRYDLTFNDILLGAYYCALYEVIQPKPDQTFCVLNTFDLRRHEAQPSPVRVSNYSSFINSNVNMKKKNHLIETCYRVKQAMDQRKAHYPGMTEGPFILPLLSLLPFSIGSAIVKALLKHRGESIPVFTNVGVIPCEKMQVNGAPIYNVRPFAPLEFPPKLTVTLATSGKSISLSVGFSKNHFQEQHIHSLFHRMEQLIVNAYANIAKAAA